MTDKHLNNTILNATFVGDEFIAQIQEEYKQAGLLAHKFNEASGVIPGTAFSVKYITDNGNKKDDLADGEVKGRFLDFGNIISALTQTSKAEFHVYNSPAQDSIGGAYDLAQIARDSKRGPGNVVFLNCAPRKNQRGQHDNNQGEQVFVGLLKDGTVVGGTGPESFTFFHDLLEQGELELFEANVQTHGSQFRSRDYWPLYTQVLTQQLRAEADQGHWKADLNLEERKELLSRIGVVNTEKPLDIRAVPKPSDNPAVVRYDVHENLKLNVRASDFAEDHFYDIDEQGNKTPKPVEITINGITETIQLGKSMFKEGAGKLSFSEGSTGQWDDYKVKNVSDEFANVVNHDGIEWSLDPSGFLQIAIINGSAKEHFKITDQQLRSDEGAPVTIKPVETKPEIEAKQSYNALTPPAHPEHGARPALG